MTISTPNLPSASTVESLIGNTSIGGVLSTAQVAVDDLAQQLVSSAPMQAALAETSPITYVAATWAALAAITGSTVGIGASVRDSDTGTHTDPVVGGTVANAGVYSWSASPAGWKRLGSNYLTAATDAEALAGIAADRTVTPANLGVVRGALWASDAMAHRGVATDRAITPANLAAVGDTILSQRLVVPGGDYSEVAVDPNMNIGYARRAATGGLITPVERISWLSSTGTPGETHYVLNALVDYDEVHVDAAGNIGAIRYRDGRQIGGYETPEVVAARASAPTLAARLARSSTPFGDRIEPVSNVVRLRRLRAKIATMRSGSAASAVVGFIGDSWTDGAGYFLAPLRSRLVSTAAGNGGLPDGGAGYIGFASPTADAAELHGSAAAVGLTRTGTWTDLFRSAGGSVGSPQPLPGADACASSVAGSRVTVTGLSTTLSAARLHHLPGGAIRYSWDAGTTWTAADLSSGTGPQVTALSLTGQSGSLTLEVVSGTVTLGGLDAQRAAGIRLHKLGSAGSSAQQWAAIDQAALATAWGGLGLDTVVVMLGANDVKVSGRTPDQVATSISTLMATARSAAPGCDLMIMVQPDIYYSTPAFEMHTLSPVLRALAADSGAAFVDLQEIFGPIAATAPYYGAYATGSANPLLGADDRHPSTTGAVTGAAVISDTLYRLICC